MTQEAGTVMDYLLRNGVSRRNFLKFCSLMAGVLAMPKDVQNQIAKALETNKRTPVVWLEMQDCTGCSESFLRSSSPSAGDLVLDVLSVDYHETLMAASGKLAEEAKAATVAAGGYLLVVEGSLTRASDGIYCCIGGRTNLDLLQEAAAGAVAVIAVGNCAAYGGLPKAQPNPTDAVGVSEIITDKPVLNLPGCPVNAVNLTATVVHYLTFGALPAMDDLGRPLFAYGHLIHDNCERRGHFDAGEFVRMWGDDGHRAGWCLYHMGCKGPITYHNCPTVRWNDGTSWPVGSGHGCVGCAEPDFWESGAYVTADPKKFTPPSTYPSTVAEKITAKPADVAATAGLAGLAVGVAATVAIEHANAKKKEKAAEVVVEPAHESADSK